MHSSTHKIFILLVASALSLISCIPTIAVFEKDISLPDHQWKSDFQPQIEFNIEDTVSLYNVYLVLRHSEAYHFNNIWIKATVQQPGEKSGKSRQFDLTLATNERGWLGSAMDDIYEQRVLIQPQTKFEKAGLYLFKLQQSMREDPLLHIFNVGIRVEKIK